MIYSNRYYNFFDKHIRDGVDPTVFGKPLKGNLKGKHRYRVGKYRIICKIDKGKLIVLVVDIDKRDKVYL